MYSTDFGGKWRGSFHVLLLLSKKKCMYLAFLVLKQTLKLQLQLHASSFAVFLNFYLSFFSSSFSILYVITLMKRRRGERKLLEDSSNHLKIRI